MLIYFQTFFTVWIATLPCETS